MASYFDNPPPINLKRIIDDAENTICKSLPEIVDKKSKEITEKILKNLEKIHTTKYEELLTKYEKTIKNNMMQEIVPRIKTIFSEVIEESVRKMVNKGGGDMLVGDMPVESRPIVELVGKGGTSTGGKSRRNRKFRKKRKTIRK